MGTTQLDLIRNQLEAAARNQAGRATAEIRRSTSLVGEAHQLMGQVQRQAEDVSVRLAAASRTRRRNARQGAETVPGPAEPAREAADGYVRRTPVQPLHVAADYKKRRIRRVIGLVAAGVALLCILWILVNSKLLTQ